MKPRRLRETLRLSASGCALPSRMRIEDRFVISRSLLEMSRSQVKRLIEGGHVRVVSGDTSGPRSRHADPCRRPRRGSCASLEPASVSPEEIPLDIVCEDSSVIVINKPRGLVVHPAPGNRSGTLVNALLNHCRILPA